MQKRGQIFILAALLLGFVIFILVSQTQYVRRNIFQGNFEELNDNYERESAKFINEIVKNPTMTMGNEFVEFTTRFTEYSKGQNPDFELIYVFDFDETLYVGNYLSKPIDVKTKAGVTKYITALPGCFEKVGGGINLGGQTFKSSSNYQNMGKCTRAEPISSSKGKITYQVEITIGEDKFAYHADITTGVPELIIVSREERGDERKVFTKGRFLKGEGFNPTFVEEENDE